MRPVNAEGPAQLSFISSCDSNKDNSPSIVIFYALNRGKTSENAEKFLFELVIIMRACLYDMPNIM